MGGFLGHFFAPLPLLIVLVGAGFVALIQQGFAALPLALGALKPLFTARPDDDRDMARAVLLRAEEIAHNHDVSRVDRLRAHHPFMVQALTTLANAPDIDRFAFWAKQALADRRARHERAIGFWNALADAAPAMGMAGTIIGLVGMFARMSDPSTIGPSMALALITTLDGMILANVVAGPIAARLDQLSQRELGWQREIADRMTALGKREYPDFPQHRPGSVREVA
ncbi:MAG: MotA/TolQ/ExbB proton channel family protein [Sphingobium sp.]|nr:MotA/TolQ/ExbB proton channel family protein [Sphingobium sp.]